MVVCDSKENRKAPVSVCICITHTVWFAGGSNSTHIKKRMEKSVVWFVTIYTRKRQYFRIPVSCSILHSLLHIKTGGKTVFGQFSFVIFMYSTHKRVIKEQGGVKVVQYACLFSTSHQVQLLKKSILCLTSS